jgi:hypothetical protein
MLAGMDGGLLTGALLADRYAISRSRMLLGDTSALAGGVAGLGLGILAEGDESNDEQARGAHEPPAALYVHDAAGDWHPGRLAIQAALDGTRAGVRPVGAWLPLLGSYW